MRASPLESNVYRFLYPLCGEPAGSIRNSLAKSRSNETCRRRRLMSILLRLRNPLKSLLERPSECASGRICSRGIHQATRRRASAKILRAG